MVVIIMIVCKLLIQISFALCVGIITSSIPLHYTTQYYKNRPELDG